MVQRRYILSSSAVLAILLLLLSFPVLGGAVPQDMGPGGGVIRFEGKIEAIGPTQWTIRGKTLFLSAQTEVYEEAGRAEVGAWATVQATWRTRGQLWADWIRIERAAGSAEQLTEFTGLIEKIGEDSWIVGGTELCITPDTVIEGQPKPGVPATVLALMAEECWEALRIHVITALEEGQQVEFEGVIQALGPALWVVSGVAVEIRETTVVVGEPQIGRWVEVAAILQTDGRVRGEHLRVLSADEPEDVEFSGLVLEIQSLEHSQEWEILRLEPQQDVESMVVSVDLSTFIDQSKALAAPGAWVQVEAINDDLGRLAARRIRVERTAATTVVGASASDLPLASGWWEVDGRCVYVHSDTDRPPTVSAGAPVQVDGQVLGNGCIWAESISLLPVDSVRFR